MNRRLLGSYTAVDIVNCIMPQLPHILFMAYNSTTVDAEKEKIVRVVNIWVSKLFITEAAGDMLIAGMKGYDTGKIRPVRPSYQSPYPQNLPPPNASQQQLQQQQQQQQQQILPPSYLLQQQQQQQQFSLIQPPPMQLAPSLAFSSAPQMPPQMPLFRPPPSFAPGAVPGMSVPPLLPPQFPAPPGSALQQHQHHQPPPPFQAFSNSTFALTQQQQQQQQQQQILIQNQQQAQMQQINQFGTFSQQAASTGFNQPPIFTSLQYPPQGIQSPAVSMSVILSTPVLDLHKISVGTMANLVKAAIKAGHPRYVPLDGRKIIYSSITIQFENVFILFNFLLFIY